MFSKKHTTKALDLSQEQIDKIDQYIQEIISHNNHTNIVGKSTLIDPWKSHVLDSVQLAKFISNKKSSILDMGTGAGIPGIILAINKFTNVSLIDSNAKKIEFVKSVCSKLDINIKVYHQRIESLINKKFDYLVSRAMANLNKLFFYSQKLLNNHTVLIFLKGEHAKDEINEAKKFWKFQYKLCQSISDERGNVVIIKELMRIND